MRLLFRLLVVSTLSLEIPVAYAQQHNVAWNRHIIDDSSAGADGVRLADVNGDGFMDIATGWEEGGCIWLCVNPGPAGCKEIWPGVTVGEAGSPEDAFIVDLDGDGAFDVVSCCEGKVKSMWVHWGPQDGASIFDADAWETGVFPVTQGVRSWMFCLPMQIDGKNGIDLVAGAKGAQAQVGWLESPENPRDLADWKWHPLCDAGWIMSLISCDMDEDGYIDIMFSDRRGDNRGLFWLEHPGFGAIQTSPWKRHLIGSGDKEVMFMTLADLDQDGLLDALAATRGQELIYQRCKTKNPLSWERFIIPLPTNAGTGKSVRVADIDLDGKLDVVFSCEHSKEKSGVLWMSYEGDVTDCVWKSHDISGLEGVKYDLVELLDLDNDGDLDVITCEESSNLGVIWYENPAK
ncbi:MAG: VCBS repeat-containing protein [bacterium]